MGIRHYTRAFEIVEGTQWYIWESINGKFYTPFSSYKREPFFIGDGETLPKPKEIVETVKELPGDIDHFAAGYFMKKSLDSVHRKEDLPAGNYQFIHGDFDNPDRLLPVDLRNDSYFEVDGTEKTLEDDVNSFVSNRDVYEENGLIYKLGILMYGPPGCGKTSLLRRLSRALVEKHQAIVIQMGNDLPSNLFIRKLQTTLPGKLKVFVFEEFVATVSGDPGRVQRMLEFLDGELAINESIVFATTNYPHELPGNIVDRPSRFDKLYKFDLPKEDERRILIKNFLGVEPSDSVVRDTKGMSVAGIKEICLRTLVNKLDLETSISELKKRSDLCRSAFSEKKTVGYGFSL